MPRMWNRSKWKNTVLPPLWDKAENKKEYGCLLIMAFFDKFGEMAKNIGDKTGDAIKIGKLNNKNTA